MSAREWLRRRLADRWRRQWHNVAVAAVLAVALTLLAAFYLTLPFGGGL